MSRGRSATTTKVFVGSLPAEASTDDLRKLFAPYGTIAECDIANRCGFLHLEDQTLATKAIEDLNDIEFMGTKISVEKGRVKQRRSGGAGPRGGRDRGGPYFRGGGDFRGRNGGFGAGRDFGPYRGGYDRGGRGGYSGGGDRGGLGSYDDRRGGRPPMGGYEDRRGGPGGYDRGGYEDRRGGYERDGYGSGGYGDRSGGFDRSGGYENRGGFDDRRGGGMGGGYDDRRSLSAETRADLYSRRDGNGPPKTSFGGANGYSAGPGAYGGNGNSGSGGYGGAVSGYGGSGSGAGGYGGTGGGAGGYGGGSGSAGGYGGTGGYNAGAEYGTEDTSGSGFNAASGYSGAPPVGGGYQDRGGYGAGADGYADSYGVVAGGPPASGGRSGYDSAYPPLPQQRGF